MSPRPVDLMDRGAEWPGDDSNRGSSNAASASGAGTAAGVRGSSSVNEWAQLRTPESCREMHWPTQASARPTFKEVTRK